jgi:hypothetical protein
MIGGPADFAGESGEYTTKGLAIIQVYADATGVDISAVTLDAISGSISRRLDESSDAYRRRLSEGGEAVDVKMSAAVADADAAAAATSSVATTLGDSPESATAAFASAGVEVLTPPVIETEVTYTEVVEDDSSSNGGLIGGVVGGIGGFLMFIGIAAFLYKRGKKNKPVYPA